MADQLLASSDANVRYFGALTFTVKINSDWDSLDEDQILSLQSILISWLVGLSIWDTVLKDAVYTLQH